MFDHVVVDVEIQKTIEETPGGWDATDKLGVSVACVWEYASQRMRVYGPEDVEALRERLLKADRVTGYNIWRFDFPVIWSVPTKKWINGPLGDMDSVQQRLVKTTDDLLARIWKAQGLDPLVFTEFHKGWSLDAVASGTLGKKKIGYGGDAPKWFQEGKVCKVVNYCADDVCLERDLSDFIDKYGYVVREGSIQEERVFVSSYKCCQMPG